MTKLQKSFRKWIWACDWISQPILKCNYSARAYREKVRKIKEYSHSDEEDYDD